MTIEETARNMAANIFDSAFEVEMAQPVATFYLHKLLNMVSNEQAQAIMAALPEITDNAWRKAIERYNEKTSK